MSTKKTTIVGENVEITFTHKLMNWFRTTKYLYLFGIGFAIGVFIVGILRRLIWGQPFFPGSEAMPLVQEILVSFLLCVGFVAIFPVVLVIGFIIGEHLGRSIRG